jgi:hypothetical protein
MAPAPQGCKVGALMLIPGKLVGTAIIGLLMETFAHPERGRVRLKMLAIHTTNQVHGASLFLENISRNYQAVKNSHDGQLVILSGDESIVAFQELFTLAPRLIPSPLRGEG